MTAQPHVQDAAVVELVLAQLSKAESYIAREYIKDRLEG